ncbi:MAG: hypothetical protein KTR35_23255 [Gammaproteobacteria bacterium]|nr:hypothetical protein [Gammaproteobacteria bacterium]
MQAFFQKSGWALAALITLSACGGGGSGGADDVRATNDPNGDPISIVQLSTQIPTRISSLAIPLDVIATVSGQTVALTTDGSSYNVNIELPPQREFPLYLAIRRSSDALLLASAQTTVNTDADVVALAIPEQLFDMDFDYDSDGFSNVTELERGSDPQSVSEDFDGDGIANDSDSDSDNDGVLDVDDAFPFNANESVDSDFDGIGDNADRDDDNDGILDVDDSFPLDASESLDLDLDGLGNNEDNDDDGDGTIDLEDPQPSNPNITGNEDSDGDGFRDLDDAFPYDPSESNDLDGDGIGDNADIDDDGNGVPDSQDNSIALIPYWPDAPTIDGAYGWSEWRNASWVDSRGNYKYMNNLLIDNYDIETDQYNWSYWRAMHDGSNLYILIIIDNEPLAARFSDSDNVWDDDSAEVYIDAGHERGAEYDHNDYQRLFRYADNLMDSQTDGFYSASGMVSSYSSSRSMAMSGAWYTYYEISISLDSVGLIPEVPFGLEVAYNDDDDTGARDVKWGWFSTPGIDEAWHNPSQFGTAILAEIVDSQPNAD